MIERFPGCSSVIVFSLAALFAPSVFGQGVAEGTWQGEVRLGEVEELWTVRIRQDGSRLSGTVSQGALRGPDVRAFTGGQLRGSSVTFEVQLGYERRVIFDGEIRGDVIDFVRTVEVFPGGRPGGAALFGAGGPDAFSLRRAREDQIPRVPRGMPFPRRLVVFDREGTEVDSIGSPANYQWIALSPDAEKLAAVVPNPEGMSVVSETDIGTTTEIRDLVVFDLETGTRTMAVTGPEIITPVWSPDGTFIAYSSYRDGRGVIERVRADGSGGEEVLFAFELGVGIRLESWSLDGRYITVSMSGVQMLLPVGEAPLDLIRNEHFQTGGTISPDGRWFAYLSDETGDWDLRLKAFDPSSGSLRDEDARVLVAAIGGTPPPYNDVHRRLWWRRDGRELYYQAGDLGIMALSLDPETGTAGSNRLLFHAPETGMSWSPQFIAPDLMGTRFVIAVPEPPERLAGEIPDEVLERLAGTYRASDAVLESGPLSRDMVITVENGALWFQASEEDERVGPMIPRTQTSFYTRRLGEEIEFFFDEAGNVTHLVQYRGFAVRRDRE